MTSWITQNRWYLVACAVLVPAALLTASTVGLFPYLASVNGERVPVRAFEPVEYGSSTYTMLEHHSFDWRTQAGANAGLLEGTELVTVTLSVEPNGGEFTGCEFTLVDRDRERQWKPATTSDAAYEIAADARDYCLSDEVDPFRVEVFFVVPAGAARGASLELSYFLLEPRIISFGL